MGTNWCSDPKIQLAPIVQTGQFSAGNAASGTVSVSVGDSVTNA